MLGVPQPVRDADLDRAVQRGHAVRVGQPAVQLGVLDERAARARAAPWHRRRLLPALVRQLPGDADRRADGSRLRPVQRDGAGRRRAARRRWLPDRRALQPQPVEGGSGHDVHDVRSRFRQADRALERYGLQRKRASSERAGAAGRREHGSHDDRQLRGDHQLAGCCVRRRCPGCRSEPARVSCSGGVPDAGEVPCDLCPSTG